MVQFICIQQMQQKSLLISEFSLNSILKSAILHYNSLQIVISLKFCNVVHIELEINPTQISVVINLQHNEAILPLA